MMLGRDPGILILGPGGVGKTTLGRILSGHYDLLLDSAGPYEQSIGVQTFRSRKHSAVELIVAPGQEDRRLATWPRLLAQLGRGNARGIILCCAYGYHSLGTSFRYHKLYDDSKPATFLPKFLKDRRMEEVRILEEICSALANNEKPTWLLTFVGKQDLWEGQDQEAQRFYATGDYGALIKDLSRKKGGQLFRHEIVLGSLVIRNFKTSRGETLAKNVSGYDHARQVHGLRNLIETLSGLQDWKGG